MNCTMMNSAFRRTSRWVLSAAVIWFTLTLHATDVGGELIGDTTWTIAGSPYVVTNDVTVATNVSLTIAAGVLGWRWTGLG